jgi:hypothetical protein
LRLSIDGVLTSSAPAGRSGGANSSGIHLKEYNLLGTGTTVSFGHSNTVDRSSDEFQFSNARALGSLTSIDLSHGRTRPKSSGAGRAAWGTAGCCATQWV